MGELYSIMMVFCHTSYAFSLWKKYKDKDNLSEDMKHQINRQQLQVNSVILLCIYEVYNKCLFLIEDSVLA